MNCMSCIARAKQVRVLELVLSHGNVLAVTIMILKSYYIFANKNLRIIFLFYDFTDVFLQKYVFFIKSNSDQLLLQSWLLIAPILK